MATLPSESSLCQARGFRLIRDALNEPPREGVMVQG